MRSPNPYCMKSARFLVPFPHQATAAQIEKWDDEIGNLPFVIEWGLADGAECYFDIEVSVEPGTDLNKIQDDIMAEFSK